MSIARFLPRFRRAQRVQAQLEQREHWTRENIEAFQLGRINRIWRHAIRNVPYYANLHRARNLPDRFDRLAAFQFHVPRLTKEYLAANPYEFLSRSATRGTWRRTSGSTGTPTHVFWGTQAHHESLAAKYRFYSMWDHGLFDRMAWLWCDDDRFTGTRGRMRQHLEDRLRNRRRFSVRELSPADLRRRLDEIEAYRPSALYGFSRALHFLAQEAIEVGFECDSLKFVNLTAEPVLPSIVETVEKAFGVPAINEYGSMECGIIAVEFPDRTLRVREDINYVETVPTADDGFDIVVTPLTNPSFPLLRYEIGDLTDAPLERPEQGFAIMQNIAGRNDDAIITATGSRIHSNCIDEVFEALTTVRRYKVHQSTDGRLSVSIVPVNPQSNFDREEVIQDLDTLVEGFPIEIKLVNQIEQTARGKHRLVTSDMSCSPDNNSATSTSQQQNSSDQSVSHDLSC